MGPLVLLGLLGLGAGVALWDMFDGKEPSDEVSPEPVEGETFDLDGADDPSTGTAGNDVVNVGFGTTTFDAGDGDDLLRVAPPDWDDADSHDEGDPIGPVLTGGEGADIFLLRLDGELADDPSTFHFSQPRFEVTDFDPEKDHLAVSLPGLYEWKYYEPEPFNSAVRPLPLDDIAVEQDPDGGFVDVVFLADVGQDQAQEFMRIRLWGVDDFDPENILVATGGSDDVADETFTPIVLGDGTPTGVGDDTALYGHTGSDTVQLDGTSGSHIFTRDGEDTVTGTADKTTIHTGDGTMRSP